MAIDTTGMAEAATPETPATAADLQNLPDATLLQELGLDKLARESEATPQSGTPAATGEEDLSIGQEELEIERFDSDSADPAGEGAGEAEQDSTATVSGGDKEKQAASGDTADGDSEGKAPRQLQAQFQVFEGNDELEIPDLTLKFNANGEEREIPLDAVVKLAQRGFYNEERAAEMRAFRDEKPQYDAAIQSLQDENRMLVEGWRRALSGDDEYLENERLSFQQAQSPEARAERAEYELARLQGSTQEGQAEREAARFLQQSLVPRLEHIEQSASEVSFEEVVGRFNLITAPLMVRGQIPPNKFHEVERLVEHELRPWVEAQHEKRSGAKKQATVASARATATAAQAKREVSRRVMPQGTPATGATRQVEKKYNSAADILNDVANIVGKRSG